MRGKEYTTSLRVVAMKMRTILIGEGRTLWNEGLSMCLSALAQLHHQVLYIVGWKIFTVLSFRSLFNL